MNCQWKWIKRKLISINKKVLLIIFLLMFLRFLLGYRMNLWLRFCPLHQIHFKLMFIILKLSIWIQVNHHILFGNLPYSMNSLSSLSLVIFTSLIHPPEEPSLDIAKEIAIKIKSVICEKIQSIINFLHYWKLMPFL